MSLAFPRRLSSAAIEARQARLLGRQLEYCAQCVPHYRQLFKKLDINVRAQPFEALRMLPVLYKDEIRSDETKFFAQNYSAENTYSSFSSGSTGQPFASYFDRCAWLQKKYYVKLRARHACGMRMGDKVAILEAEAAEITARRNRNARWQDPVLKVRVFSLFQPPEKLWQQLQGFAPNNIYAYPSHLLELLAYRPAEPTSAKPIASLERLFTSSEFLSAGTRAEITRAFGAEVFDHYGNTEFKEVAWECHAHNFYHINHDQLILETLLDGEPVVGRPGEIVLTDLRNRAMPLLRYSTGDLGILGNRSCPCGYQGPGMKPLGGRSSDYLIMPDDTRISPYQLTTVLEKVPDIRQYQIRQTAADKMKVLFVSALSDEHSIRQQCEQLRSAMHDGLADIYASRIRIEIEHEARLEQEANGKFKVIKREF